jgi:excisionase family DNA binding protein
MATTDGWPSAPLLTIAQVSAILRMDRETVAKAIRAGQIPAHVVGVRWYVPAAQLRTWLGQPPIAPIEPRPRVRF